MTVKVLHQEGVSHGEIAKTMGVTEGAIRYHLRRQAAGAIDGRSLRQHRAAPWREAIDTFRAARAPRPLHLAELHEWLVAEHGYEGSLRSIERYCASHFEQPKLRARRRVETPPGAQAQVDWAQSPPVIVGGEGSAPRFDATRSASFRAGFGPWSGLLRPCTGPEGARAAVIDGARLGLSRCLVTPVGRKRVLLAKTREAVVRQVARIR